MTDDLPAPAPAARRSRTPTKRPKRVRWTARREAKFLQALTEWSNIAKACRVAGLAESTVYRRRQNSDEFRARWSQALGEGVVRLETLLLERALHGVEKPVWHGGKQVGTMREYSDRLALALLAAHRPRAAEPPADDGPPAMTEAEQREEVLRRLSEMNRRMGGEG